MKREGEMPHTLSYINLVLEFASSSSRLGEDGSSVAVGVAVDDLDGFVQSLSLHQQQHGAKHLFLIDPHVGLDTGDDSGREPVAALIPLDSESPAVEVDLGSLGLGAVHQISDAILGLRSDQRAEMGVGVAAERDLELGSLGGNVVDPVPGIADQDGEREGHAALSGSTESSANELLDSVLPVGIGQHHGVVLCAQIRLHTLVVLGAAVEDVLAGIVTSDERDGSDVLVVADEVDGGLGAVDDVDHSRRHTSLQRKLGAHHSGGGVVLRGLENHGVACSDGHGEHPQRDHGGEVAVVVGSGDERERDVISESITVQHSAWHGMAWHGGMRWDHRVVVVVLPLPHHNFNHNYSQWCDASSDTEGLSVAVDVHVGGHVLHSLAHDQCGHGCV